MGRNPMVSGAEESHARPWTLIIALGAAVIGLVSIIVAEFVAGARYDKAEDQVYAWSARLNADHEETGKWKRWPDATVSETDPWGHPLRVRYEQGKYSEKLTVSSDGADGTQWTHDDIASTVTNTNWIDMAREGAGAVEEVAGAASRGVVGGAIEGVTDHIPKPLRDKMGIPSERDKPDEKPQK